MDEVTVPAEGSASGGESSNDAEFDSGFLDDVILELGEQKTTRETYSSEQPNDDEDDSGKSGEPEDGKKPEPEKTEDKRKPKKSDSPDDEEDDESPTLVQQLRNKIKGKDRYIRHLESTMRKSEKPKSEEPDPLSDDQLKALMKEHADDPDVMFNIMKYMQERGMKDATKASQELAKRDKVAQAADKYFSSVFSGYGQEEFNDQLDNDFPPDQWGIQGHPLARQIQSALALAGTFHGAVQREVQKAIQAKEKETKTKVEDKRKEAVQQRGGLPKPATDAKGAANPALDERRISVAKELGLTPSQQKLYANLLGGKKG